MNMISTAVTVRLIRFFFTSFDNSSENGITKWNRMMAIATNCHPWSNRVRNQWISSGKFPAQMIRNCENETYAQNMVKASISFPMSCMMSFLKNKDIGSCFESIMQIAAVNESAESACPARKIMPKMVEYQCGSSDITQSNDANVMLKQ